MSQWKMKLLLSSPCIVFVVSLNPTVLHICNDFCVKVKTICSLLRHFRGGGSGKRIICLREVLNLNLCYSFHHSRQIKAFANLQLTAINE